MSSHRDGFEVLDACHRQMLFSLGKLSALISRLRVFGHDAEARSMAEDVITFFSTTVRSHHEDEERHVFPRLVASRGTDVVEAVLRLQKDHDWLEEDWMAIEPHLAAVATGRFEYNVDTLHDLAAEFAALLHDHIALEESLIYPKARATLQPGERRAMGREMAERRRAQGVAI
jgi:hemerythrin-like domain-containing protein